MKILCSVVILLLGGGVLSRASEPAVVPQPAADAPIGGGLSIRATVPADAPSFNNAQWHVILYAFDPRLADAPANVALEKRREVSHQRGMATHCEETLEIPWQTSRGFYVVVEIEKNGRRLYFTNGFFAVEESMEKTGPVAIEIAHDHSAPVEEAVSENGPVRADAQGTFYFPVSSAKRTGNNMGAEGAGGALIGWQQDQDRAEWTFELEKGGVFEVRVELACADNSAGSRYAVTVVDQSVAGVVPGTGGWDRFEECSPGRITLPGAGGYNLQLRVRVKPELKTAAAVRAVRLVPVAGEEVPR